MPDALTIREAVATDVPAIVALIRGLAEYERLPAEPDPASLTEHLFGEPRYAEVLIAEVSGAAVGFALFFPNYSTFLTKPGIYLEDLYVRPEYRKRRHGKGLILELARIAVERGCGRLEWVVLDWNEPAQRFYKSLGAEPLDEWTTYRLTGEALAAAARQRTD